MRHEIKRYHDGYKWIEYCIFCSKEGEELVANEECSGEIVDKKIDKRPEPS